MRLTLRESGAYCPNDREGQRGPSEGDHLKGRRLTLKEREMGCHHLEGKKERRLIVRRRRALSADRHEGIRRRTEGIEGGTI